MKPHLSGWCSPTCSPRSHATCQKRLDRKQLDRCDCIHHDREQEAEMSEGTL